MRVFYQNAFILIALVLLLPIKAHAEREVINYLSAGPNICTPVTVKCNKGTFQVYYDETIVYGNLMYIEAWDCQGRKIIDTEADSYTQNSEGPYKRWFKFSTLYPETTSSSDNYNRHSSSSSNPVTNVLSRHTDDIARTGADALTYVFENHVKEWSEWKKRLDVIVSYDSGIGGTALGLQYRTPIVFGVIARAGYNFKYNKYSGDDKIIHWSAGIQFWIKNWNIFEMGVGNYYFKHTETTNIGIYMTTNYTQQIYRGLGINAGLGFSIRGKDPENHIHPIFIWHAGLVWRFCLD